MKNLKTSATIKWMRITLVIVSILLVAFIAINRFIHTQQRDFSISPYPNCKNFAFSIIDDTDYSIGPDIWPVYELLYKLGFRTTKTVWVFKQKHTNAFRKEKERDTGFSDWGATLEDENYLKNIKELDEKGFEIALHGITAGNDYREEIVNGYEKFYQIFRKYPTIDILHAQNIENLYAGSYKLDIFFLRIIERLMDHSQYQGHIQDSDYFWGDICQRHVKYVRLPFHTIKEINVLKICPTFPFHDPKRPYVNYWFPNSDGSDIGDFLRLTAKKNIERLESERGVAIIYTHFANGFTKKSGKDYILDENFIKRMNYISQLDGWFATATEILDRFVSIKEITLYETKDVINVINTGEKEIDGFTLLGPLNSKLVDLSGRVYAANESGEIHIGTLPPQSALFFQHNNKIDKKEILLRKNRISRIKRMKIEIKNYMGEIFDSY